MLRLTWPATALPPRHLSEDDFVREFGPLAERGFPGLPAGPVVVEGFDTQHRRAWYAHYESVRGLGTLLRQLREEHALKARGGA